MVVCCGETDGEFSSLVDAVDEEVEGFYLFGWVGGWVGGLGRGEEKIDEAVRMRCCE